MNIYSKDNNLVLEHVADFDIEDILECGQCFHFTKLGEKDYELLAHGRYLHVLQNNDVVTLFDTNEEDYNLVWKDYFDIATDYKIIKDKIIVADERLKTVVWSKPGIRILKQDFFEVLISFIISQNNHIPRIKQIINTISERFGEVIILPDGRAMYNFPEVDKLIDVSEEELRDCKVGFRAPYICEAVRKVYNGEIKEENLKNLNVTLARDTLMSIKGVGEKVANCVLLFGLGFTDVFPVDVWMKRIMETMYFEGDTKKNIIESKAYEMFGEYAGYAQQYLFHYGRCIGLGK